MAKVAEVAEEDYSIDGLDIEYVRNQCLTSIFWTAYYLLRYRKLSIVLHKGMADWYQQRLEAGDQRFLMMAPRNHYKTSVLGVASVVWRILNDPDTTILYVMHEHTLCTLKMDEARAAFESSQMKVLFPSLYVHNPGSKGLIWSSKHWTVPRENQKGQPTVVCKGITAGFEGIHVNHIIFDDVIDGESSDSDVQMDSAIRKLGRISYLRKDRETSTFSVMGTLWEGGFYEKLINNPYYKSFIIGCYVDDRFNNLLKEAGIQKPSEDYINKKLIEVNRENAWEEGQPIFPEEETLESLDAYRSEGEDEFIPQMLNEPFGLYKRDFQREDCLGYTPIWGKTGLMGCVIDEKFKIPISSLYITLGYDPSGGQSKTADWAAVTVMGWHKIHGMAFMLDYWHGLADPYEQIKILLKMADKWNPRVLSIESGAMQVSLVTWISLEMKRIGRSFNIEPFIKGPVSKHAAIIKRLQPLIKGHTIYFQIPAHNEIIDQLVSFKVRNKKIVGDSPAILDSMVCHTPFWRRNPLAFKQSEEPDFGQETKGKYEPRPPAYGLEMDW